MHIGFDLDKVFVDYPQFMPDSLVDRLYKKKSNGVLLYRIPSRPEQIVRRMSHMPIFRPLIQENIDFLKNISKKDHKLYLISSRFGFLKQQTEELVTRLGFADIFDGIYFNYNNLQPHLFKSDIISKLHIDLYIDDDLGLIKYVAKKSKKTTFFWLNAKEKKRMLTRNIIAVSRISDILPPKI